MRKKIGYILGVLIPGMLLGASLNYETYLESWNPNWLNVVNGLPASPAGGGTFNGVTLNIAFAEYVFTGTTGLNGLQFTTMPDNVNTVITTVHAAGGLVKPSFGGASSTSSYFISKSPDWPNNIPNIVAGISKVFQHFAFDGVDFDIEDPLPSGVTAELFATQLCSFLLQVKTALPTKTVSLTIPGQGWNTYWELLAQQAVAQNAVDYINFMEYDIWAGSPGYVGQITADIITYSGQPNTAPGPNRAQGWGIPLNMIQVGLMPGTDDTGQILPLQSIPSLITTFIQTYPVVGIMTWDLTRDFNGATGSSAYAYTKAIRQTIFNTTDLSTPTPCRTPNQRCHMFSPPFERQNPPPHGHNP
jgi:hypothetical protein